MVVKDGVLEKFPLGYPKGPLFSSGGARERFRLERCEREREYIPKQARQRRTDRVIGELPQDVATRANSQGVQKTRPARLIVLPKELEPVDDGDTGSLTLRHQL